MTGLAATGLLMAITLIGHNLVSLHAWHTRRGLPEPWQAHLGEPVDDRPMEKATRTRGRRNADATEPPRPGLLTPHDVGASLPEKSHRTPKPGPRHTKTVSAETPAAGTITTTTKPPARSTPPEGEPTAGSFGKPKRVVQGTTRCAQGGTRGRARLVPRRPLPLPASSPCCTMRNDRHRRSFRVVGSSRKSLICGDLAASLTAGTSGHAHQAQPHHTRVEWPSDSRHTAQLGLPLAMASPTGTSGSREASRAGQSERRTDLRIVSRTIAARVSPAR